MENSLGCVWVPKLAFLLFGFTLASLQPRVSGKSALPYFPLRSGARGIFLRIPKQRAPFSGANGLFSPSASTILVFRGVLLSVVLASVSFCITSHRWEGGSGVRSALRSLGEKGQRWKEGNPWKNKGEMWQEVA